jgi:hypothetical protein
MYLDIAIYGEDPKGEKQYALNYYFNHNNVIKLDQ